MAPSRLVLLLAFPLVAAACGSDDGGEQDGATETSAARATSTSASSTTANSVSDTSTAPGAEPETGDGTITLYSGRDEELVGPLIEQFTADTGIDVEARYGNAAEMGAALLEEGEATPADVFYSQEAGALGVLAKEGLLAELPAEVMEQVDARFRPSNGSAWVGVTARARVIAYNPELVADPPASVLDLTDPKYEGQVGIVPGNASFQSFVTAFRISQGDDAARQWLEDMQANGVVTSYESNGDLLTAVDEGQIGIGLINHYYWAQLVAERGGPDGVNAQLVFADGDDPGALVNATAAGLLANAADDPDALAFVEYLLSEPAQTYFAQETFEYPLLEGIADPEGVPTLEELQGPQIDLTDLDSLQQTQAMLADVGLI